MSPNLKAFLDQQRIVCTTMKHPVAYTAQEIAAAQHVPGKQLAKCVLVKTNHGVRLAVLPAVYRVDFTKLRKLLNATSLSLASEADIQHAFPGVEVGAMSMFGNLYSVPVVVDKSLAESVDVVCNAGTHSETIKLRYRDFERAVKPKVGAFLAAQPAASKSKPKSTPKKNATAKKKKAKRPARRSPPRHAKKAARAKR